MATTQRNSVTPRDAARILFRHWRKIAATFCGVILLMLLAIALYPRTYISDAKFMIRIGRESVGLDPTATTGETIMLQKTQEDEINSALNILTSREILQRVVEQVGATRILKDSPVQNANGAAADSSDRGMFAWVNDTLETLHLSDPGTAVDQAVRQLEKKCVATAPKLSTVITISCTAKSPELAHDIVESMTNVFLAEHSRLSQSDGSLAFFSEQTQKLYGELTAAQQKLRDRKNGYQLTSAEGTRSMLEHAKDAMRQKVYDLQAQENDLMSRYTDEYPPLKEVRRQRQMAENMVTNINDSVAPKSETVATTTDDKTKASPAVYQITKTVSSEQGSLNAEVQSLNDQEYELAQLEREVKLLEGKYAMHVEKLEQARLNDALSKEQFSNVKIAQAASLIHKPIAPKKGLVLAGALLLALVGGFGTAFAAERMDQTLRTTDQIERELGLPVLASLSVRKKNRKKANGAKSASNGSATHIATLANGQQRNGSYHGLVTALRSMHTNGGGSAKAIAVVGCETSKARSRVAGNLAVEAATSGSDPVLLIDADARRRRIAKRFNLNGAPGWRDVVSGTATAKSCVQDSQTDNLDLMGPGRTNGDASAAAPTNEAATQLDGLKSNYSLVIVDLPPAGELDGLSAAAKWIDESVLVVDAEQTRVQAAQRAKDLLQRAGVPLTGVVLVNRRDYIPRWLYQRL